MKHKIAILLLALAPVVALAQDPVPVVDPPVVVDPYAPYAPPQDVVVCQMDMSQTPPAPSVDEGTGVPRCFQVKQEVSAAILNWMLTQKVPGVDEQGRPLLKLKYASWWDAIIKFFLYQMAIPALDQFPPDSITQAKAQAKAAAEAVDAAKASVMGVDVGVVAGAQPVPMMAVPRVP